MININYVVGDATDPIGEGNKIIAHICNDVGAWGAGFVKALSAKWEAPEETYREWYNYPENFLTPFQLGQVTFVRVEDDIFVANMIAQHKVRSPGYIPVRYTSIATALQTVATFAIHDNASVHMPRIGCGLAGGEWEEVEPIIKSRLSSYDIPVYVYDLT